MTAPASILSLAYDHVRAAMIGIGIVAIVAVVCLAYRTGRHAQATDDAVALADARDSVLQVSRTHLEQDADSMRRVGIVLARTQAKLDSVNKIRRSESAEKVTAASLARSVSRIDSASSKVVIRTDTGFVTLSVPPLVAVTWGRERTAHTSAITSLTASIRADSLSLAERDVRLKNDDDRIATYTKAIAVQDSMLGNRNEEIATLKKAKRPRFTAAEGFVTGAVSVAALLLLVP